MMQRVVVVIDDWDDIGALERAVLQLVTSGDVGIHVVSVSDCTEDGDTPKESMPSRLRLMLLLARLADRLVPATGEVVLGRELGALAASIHRQRPLRVLVATRPTSIDRWLRRDLVSQVRRLFSIDVQRLPAVA